MGGFGSGEDGHGAPAPVLPGWLFGWFVGLNLCLNPFVEIDHAALDFLWQRTVDFDHSNFDLHFGKGGWQGLVLLFFNDDDRRCFLGGGDGESVEREEGGERYKC